ncbi:MAG: adenylate/guanylate cyclase domain-containing protein [Actinomycetota bacterium]
MPRAGDRVLAAVLFTDIVGSTTITATLGDARWRSLLTRHHSLARQALKDFEGELLDTAGDGLFAIFGSPAAAIRCACRIAERVQALGIEIRAGVHFGETEPISGKLGGIAVVTCARVMSVAGPSEVLVTATVREMAAGSGFAFKDRGSRRLKGIEQSQHLFAVTSVDDEPLPPPLAPSVSRERLAAIEASPRPRRRRPLVAIGLVLALVAVAAIVFRPRHPEIPKIVDGGPLMDVALRIDLDGTVQATVPNLRLDANGIRPQIAIGEAGVWIIDAIGLTHIDPLASTVEERVPVRGYQLGATGHAVPDIAVGARLVWMTGVGPTPSGTSIRGHVALERIDPATNERLSQIRFGAGTATGVAVDEDFAWETVSSGAVEKVDAETGEKLASINVGEFADLVTAGEGAIWIGDLVNSTVTRVDAVSDVVGDPIELGGAVDALAAGEGGVWALDRHAGTVTRIDATTGGVGEPFRVGSDPGDIAVGLGSLWVSSESDGTVWKVNPSTEEATRFDFGAPVIALAVDEGTGTVWLLIPPSP